MKQFIYTVYDPEIESFDQRLSLAPFGPDEMQQQYRRAFIKMEAKDKSFMLGKKAILLGSFDDETGKIEQGNLVEVFHFVERELPKNEVNEGESTGKEECQENSNISTETKDQKN